MKRRHVTKQMVEAIRELKAQRVSDQQIAEQMNLTIHQIHYIREIHGIGSVYSKYKEEQ